MKTKITALALAAVTALSFAPKPAKAGDTEWALVGGLIGGIMIGAAINDSHHSTVYPPHNTAVVVRGPVVNDCDDRAGYWKDVSVKVWVPGCWIVERSRHGHSREVRRYVNGHYEFRSNRVWVAYDRGHNNRYDNHRSDYGRGR
jgi:hypothetical protein